MSERNKTAQRRKSGWKQWTPVEARRSLTAWRRSGLPLATFARRNGIGAQRLRWWSKRLVDERTATDGRNAAESLRLLPAVVTAPLVGLAGASVSIRLPGGAVVEIADVRAVPPAWVRELIATDAEASR